MICEAGLDHDGPESDKFGQGVVVADKVGCESAWVLPGVESHVAVLACSGVDADAEYEEPKYGKDLDRGEPELELAVEGHGEEIDSRDDDPKDADEYAYRKRAVPVLDDETRSCELQSKSHSPREPVDPPHGEAKTGIDKAGCIVGEGSGDGNVGRHFAEGGDHAVDDASHKHVGYESTCWP